MAVSGFVLLDKPVGITSRAAGARVARIFGTKKFGHVGTLDPMASGLLIIALGNATKMIPYLPDGVKGYEFAIQWGVQTDTGDITGSVQSSECSVQIPTDTEIIAACGAMTGACDQMPPAFSAKKIDGVPAYKRARRGESVALKPKRITIYDLEFNICENKFVVKCSPGTYVRSLVQDLAEKCGTIATTSMIRRTVANGVLIKDAVKLDFLENLYNNAPADMKNYIMPADFGLDGIPVCNLNNADARLFANGGFVSHGGSGLHRALAGNEFIGIGEAADGVLKPKRILNVAENMD
ncbi:MAG: tRNA pseudouridine(55) synthase TruB [Rickettsiales bacterium]|jgi:tRNA pseudouridine55 synthase|nr:tRNA pseudouridine(55) synthase TruB [Rickettsiales bacterium]